ncbi:MAG: PD-(D/E)XK nuclease family protein [Oscillospiraceae bacterium]|nr:PD-(D/E)XK nuclease family protein [Oscillospiraceae bacterium]
MLKLLIGRACSGKSARILREICGLGDDSQQILLVPEHASHAAETDICRACGDTASRHVEALTFKQLARRVLSLTGGLCDYALDAGGKLLTLERALYETATQLRVYKRPSQRVAFLGGLMRLFDEFSAYEIAPETLFTCAEDIGGAQGDKLHDLALLYGVYAARLQNGGEDLRDRMGKLVEKLEESGYIDGKDIFLDGFSYFNAQEERTLAVMLRRARSVTVTLLGERGNGSEIFAACDRTRERLVRLARVCGVPCEIEWLAPQEESDALSHIERRFFGENAAWEGDASCVCIRRADSIVSECEWAAAEILRLVRCEGYRFRDFTVTTRSLADYETTLQSVFARCGVPLFRSGRTSAAEKSVAVMLTAALDAVSGGFEYEDVFRCLKTGLAGIDAASCDLLENYIIRWEVHGNMWMREADWTAHPRGFGAEWSEADTAALARINELRACVRALFRPLYDAMRGETTVREKTAALYAFAQAAKLPQEVEQRAAALFEAGEGEAAEELLQLWGILCDVLDQFAEILGESVVDAQEYARLFTLVLTQYSVGSIPVSCDQVNFAELTQNDRHRVRCLFILGATDQSLPATALGGGILTDEDRDALAAHSVRLAPYGDEQYAMELQNIYAALAQPSERLYAAYPALSVSGAALRPSFVIERLRALCPHHREENEGDKSYRTASRASALSLAGTQIDGALWRYFEARGDCAQELAAMRRAAALRRGRLSPDAVRSLYGERFYMSASRVDKARRCHFAYFLQYGLRARRREKSSFDAPEIGTFMHYILENVTSEILLLGGWAEVDDARRRALVDKYIRQYTEREFGNFADKDARFRYLFARLRRTVYAVVDELAQELQNSDFVPCAFELKFGAGGAMNAIAIETPTAQMHLTGVVDRVDGWLRDGKLYLRVVDYKTGKKSFDLSEIRYGLGLQMLLYLFTLAREGAGVFGHEIVPAGVLYTPARDVILSMPRGASEEEIRRAMEKELRRSGMVLCEPEVLQAMEHSALTQPHYLPLRVARDGSISGGVATAQQLGKLGKYVELLLCRITDELARGNIDADPCAHSADDNACTYCEYADACHFEDGYGGDHIEYIKKTAAEESLQHIDAELEREEAAKNGSDQING